MQESCNAVGQEGKNYCGVVDTMSSPDIPLRGTQVPENGLTAPDLCLGIPESSYRILRASMDSDRLRAPVHEFEGLTTKKFDEQYRGVGRDTGWRHVE